MRTTLDLPDDVHRYARQLAHEQRRSMGDVIADLVRAGLNRVPEPTDTSQALVSPVTGLLTFSVGHPVTTEDVKSLEDDE